MENKVLDEAVEVALGFMPASLTHSQAWPTGYVDGHNDAMQTVEAHMRAALLASLPVLLGEVVADWRAIDSGGCSGVYHRLADQLESIYAPSLGEGDGR